MGDGINVITMESINEENSKVDSQKAIVELQKKFNDLAEKHNTVIKLFENLATNTNNIIRENDFRDSLLSVLFYIIIEEHGITKEDFARYWKEVHEEEIDKEILNAFFND